MFLEISPEILPVGLAESVPSKSFPGPQHIIYKSNQESLKNPINSNVPPYKREIVWTNVVVILILHLIAVYGVWLMMTQIMWRTFIFFNVYSSIISFGITAGSHRLWTHKSYKAKLPLRIFLMLCQTATFQFNIHTWVRDHRTHHKYSDTDADPYNASRGLFFSHIGWVLVKKHKDVINKGKTIDLSDIMADPVVMFQKRYYGILVLLFTFIIPIYIPCYFWGEDWWLSWIVLGFTKLMYIHNAASLVNSVAHAYGTKPYDKRIEPNDNKFIAWITYGEGWHNYHHAFPWDYKTGELGNYELNVTTAFIDLMAKLGQAYDLKTVTPEIVKKRVQRTGDGSWKGDSSSSNTNGTVHDHNNLWGWGDEDMNPDEMKDAEINYKLTE